MEKRIKTGKVFRDCEFTRAEIDRENRTAPISFSSEDPYERWWGTEILDHEKKSVVLDRLKKGGALLMDHNTTDQVGVIDKAWIGSDRRGRALVRFGRSSRAEEVFQDVVDGIRQSVSVGYIIHRMKQEESDPDAPVFRATRWEPLEISLVSVPADTNVGVSRSDADSLTPGDRNIETIIEMEDKTMPDDIKKDDDQKTAPAVNATPPAAAPVQTRSGFQVVNEPVDIEKERRKEQKRVRELIAYGDQFDCRTEAMAAIQDGISVDEFRQALLARMKQNVTPVETNPDLGLTDREKKEFSVVRLMHALANPQDRAAREGAAFEFEASEAFSQKVRKQPKGAFLPPDIFKRDMVVGTDTAGGYLVATNLLAAQFIDLLRNKMVVEMAGATILRDLVGDIAIPKQTGGATAYWVAESGAPTEAQQTLGQIALTPKTVAAFTDYSRKLMLQSSIDIENFVRNDLTRVLALAVDLAALHGSGSSNQPTGIASTSGIGSVAGGTNGLAPTWAHAVTLETEVAQDNADVGRLAYISNAKVRGKLKQVFTNATYGEIPLWQRGVAPGIGELNGYPAYVTNQASSTLTKGSSSGVCSAIFFGNWADLIIGLWSGIDLLVDPYTGSSTATVRVTAFQDVDLGVRHAQSFSAMLDALTT